MKLYVLPEKSIRKGTKRNLELVLEVAKGIIGKYVESYLLPCI